MTQVSNQSTITTFLRGKGLTTAQVAGVAGNLQIESGFSPTAYNPGEKAIGIAQWEGSRRTALQAYARKAGTSETDLKTQLGFLWHELTTSESGALAALRATSTPAAAAASFDKRYERSSGAARSARESAATVIARTLNGTGGKVKGSAPAGPATTGTTATTTLDPTSWDPRTWPGEVGGAIGGGLGAAGGAIGDVAGGLGSAIGDGIGAAAGQIAGATGDAIAGVFTSAPVRDLMTRGVFLALGLGLVAIGAAKLAAPAKSTASQTIAPIAAAVATKGAA